MKKIIPNSTNIISDLHKRLKLLSKLIDYKMNLTDEEWTNLIYYTELHSNKRLQFIHAIESIRNGDFSQDILNGLTPHAKWLIAVYTGQELKSKWCYGGSRYHKKVISMMNDDFIPSSILRQIPDLKEALNEFKARFPHINPEVIDNIAIDETFELLGRAMSL